LPSGPSGEKREGGKSRAIGISGLGRFFSSFPLISSRFAFKVKQLMKTLGIWWMVYGIFRVVMGIVQILFAPTATVMFGALLVRVVDPFTLMGLFHIIYVAVILWSLVCGVLGIIGGIAALRGTGSGRGLLIAASLVSLPELLLGIALGVYTLIELLPSRRLAIQQD
jgi:hypothetical protein